MRPCSLAPILGPISCLSVTFRPLFAHFCPAKWASVWRPFCGRQSGWMGAEKRAKVGQLVFGKLVFGKLVFGELAAKDWPFSLALFSRVTLCRSCGSSAKPAGAQFSLSQPESRPKGSASQRASLPAGRRFIPASCRLASLGPQRDCLRAGL